MPPATPKFAFAPDGVPVIQPPPVMKSAGVHPGGGGGGGAGAQGMSACAEEMITSATPSTLTWRGLTVMSPEPALVCSFITTLPVPFGSSTVWFGVPSTRITCPFTDRRAMCELPLAVAPPSVHIAVARASRKPAEILLVPTVRASSATDASDRLALPWPTLVACSTSAVSNPGTLASRSDASLAPPDDGREPASTSVTAAGKGPNSLGCPPQRGPLEPVARRGGRAPPP